MTGLLVVGQACVRKMCKTGGAGVLPLTGVSDHVHLLVLLGRSVSQADLVKELKRGSNLWIHERFPRIQKFAWQAGYGAFSVSASNLQAVRSYVETQAAHHAKVTFQEEFRAVLQKHGVAFDERYVWD